MNIIDVQPISPKKKTKNHWVKALSSFCVDIFWSYYSYYSKKDVGVSENNGTPKSSILIGFSIINHPFWGTTIFGNIHVVGGNSLSYLQLNSTPLVGSIQNQSTPLVEASQVARG